MNEATQNFVEDLKQRPDVLGVILFGSWARGNNRPDSDLDLIVILTEGFRRAVEYHDGQIFEIVYTTEKSALEFWESHKDDAYGLWEVAKVLYDKDGTIARLKNTANKLLEGGKNPIDEYQLKQLRFDAEDQIRHVQVRAVNDLTTANLILTNKIYQLTELFFDIRQMWTPAPKQRVEKIKEISPEFHSLLKKFYQDHASFSYKLEIAKKMTSIVFESI